MPCPRPARAGAIRRGGQRAVRHERLDPGWIGKIAGRLADALFGFEADAKTALLATPVALADETSVNTIEDDPGWLKVCPWCGLSRHAFTLRTEKIVWLGAGHTRGHGALDRFGLFERYTGTLASDT